MLETKCTVNKIRIKNYSLSYNYYLHWIELPFYNVQGIFRSIIQIITPICNAILLHKKNKKQKLHLY